MPRPWFPTFLEQPTKTQEHPTKEQGQQGHNEVITCFKAYLVLEDKAYVVVPFQEYYISKYITKYGRRPMDLDQDYLKVLEHKQKRDEHEEQEKKQASVHIFFT